MESRSGVKDPALLETVAANTRDGLRGIVVDIDRALQMPSEDAALLARLRALALRHAAAISRALNINGRH